MFITLFIKFAVFCLIVTFVMGSFKDYNNKTYVAKRKYVKEAEKFYKSDCCTKDDLSEIVDYIYDDCHNPYQVKRAYFAWQKRMKKSILFKPEQLL